MLPQKKKQPSDIPLTTSNGNIKTPFISCELLNREQCVVLIPGGENKPVGHSEVFALLTDVC